ncbi:spermidine/putrescine ABC transporter, ATP-binding protein [Campylobacter iguaniorum]|uniref:Spermidine/putrescine ABC transporter, ATP-binding protein n=1 Tax=Campylobacter iguaniorum TaxID=1244531 RepID=A0A076FBD0_9BACT|nr:ABC transporter ATP-binding protein [Campylobacter iguaniorum]AII14983.1 spermidine/putrescine ABC transporter, ATP-binding protein [Campylobacter iguaniorum]
MSYLQIKNLKKSYKDKLVFDDINFSAKKGELVTLLGPSGCGKSTLLRCICGLSDPQSGKIILDDKDITKVSIKKRNIGMVFQNYALFPNLNVYENIAYGLKIKNLDKKDIEKRVKKMLEIVGLEKEIKSYPHNLSGGQAQRVALARSLVTKPSILLLDEPLSALDAKIRKHLRGQIKLITKKMNLTTIFVTHDQEEALAMSDRIILMENGKIAQNSDALELYLKPKNKFVASFIGSYNILSPEALSNLIEHSFKTDVAIRPETIEIAKYGSIEALIKEKMFLGNVIRYFVIVKGVELKIDTLNYSLNSLYNIGDSVFLTIHKEMIKELDDLSI